MPRSSRCWPNGITANSAPQSITAGPDGNLWFTESAANKIGRITPTGVVTEFVNGLSAGSKPWGITSGPDGNLWITERGTSKIGRITPQGVITEFATITPNAAPWGITAGSDGNLWFTENGVNSVGRITTAGVQLPEIPLCVGCADNSTGGQGIVAGPDGNLWFAERNSNRIGRMLSGVVPVNVTPPGISGTPNVGSTLTVSYGAWKYLPTTYAYKWFRCTTAAATKCSTIVNKTTSTYVVTSADTGSFLRASVTPTNLNGAAKPTPSPTATQVPSSAFSITKPRITYKTKSVVLTSTIITNWAGKAVQTATSKSGSKVTRRCIITKRIPVAGVATIVCTLQRASRQTLRKQSLKLTITTTFTATGGAAKSKTQVLTVPKRVKP